MTESAQGAAQEPTGAGGSRFPLKDFARYVGAFALAPVIVTSVLVIIDAAMRGWRFASDPEAIAYLFAFMFMSLPGLVVGLLSAGYVLRSFADFGLLMKLGLAALAGTVGSCIGSGIVFVLLTRALGTEEFFPALLILPTSLGIAGGVLLALFARPRGAGSA